MRRALHIWMIGAAAIGIALSTEHGTRIAEASAAAAEPSGPRATIPDFVARLEALTPGTPGVSGASGAHLTYFELAEEVSTEMPDASAVALARRLFVLSYALEPPTGALRASACYALASLATDERERRRLLALAEALRPPETYAPSGGSATTSPSSAAGRPPSGAQEASFALATALGLYRSGDYGRAASIFERADVRALLDRFSGQVGGAEALLREVRSRPTCRECRNQRVVRTEDAGGGGPPPLRLCSTCGGNPGPPLEPARRLSILRVESALLSGAQQSWATQLLADQGARLIELNPEDVPELYGVDVSASVYRDGAWVAPPRAAEGPAPTASPGAIPGASPGAAPR